MHHLKETVIDGVKFVLIPEMLWEEAKMWTHDAANQGWESAMDLCQKINTYEEVRNAL